MSERRACGAIGQPRSTQRRVLKVRDDEEALRVGIVILASRLWRLPPRLVRWVRVAPPVIVLCTTTYLSHHWITDGLAALALGLLLDRIIHRVDWDVLLP